MSIQNLISVIGSSLTSVVWRSVELTPSIELVNLFCVVQYKKLYTGIVVQRGLFGIMMYIPSDMFGFLSNSSQSEGQAFPPLLD